MKTFINTFNNNLLQQRLVYYFALLCSLFFLVAGQEQKAWLYVAHSIGAIVLAACNMNDLHLRKVLLFAFTVCFMLALLQTYTVFNLPSVGATVLQGLKIESGVTVGAGASAQKFNPTFPGNAVL